MRVMMGLGEPPNKLSRAKHVTEVVGLFLRAYRPEPGARR
jgi:hypothetical protein